MTQFKGTPGPWEVEDNGYFYDIKAGRATVGDVCSSASWFDNDEHRGPVATANAQLIAAAPELLEALQLCEEFMSQLPSTGFDGLARIEFARAAINKATGDER